MSAVIISGVPVPNTSICHPQRSPSNSSLESSTPPSPITSRMGEDSVSSPPRTHNGRQRLRPWLVGLIDRGEVKGLEWMNKEKTLFKIPWKHAGKQDYNPEEDSKVFKLWSTNTGKYKEGVHVPEPAVWKTRLRTALNKLPDIDEIQEKTQLDIPEPYRVYRLLPKKSKFPAGPHGRQRTRSDCFPQEDMRYQVPHPIQTPMSAPPLGSYQRSHHGYHLNGAYDRTGYYGEMAAAGYDYNSYLHQQHQYRRDPISPTSTGHGQLHTLDDIQSVIQETEHPSPTGTPQFGSHDMSSCSPPAPMYPSHPNDVTDGDDTATKIAQAMITNNNDPTHISNYHDLLPPTAEMNYPVTTRAYPGYVSHQNQAYNTTCAPVTMSTDTMTTTDDHHQRLQESPMDVSCRSQENRQAELPSEQSMKIEVYYRSVQALSRQIDNPTGCMLYSKQPWEEGIQLGMEAIHLPDIADIIDPHTPNVGQTIGLTNEVLRCFEKGISIQLKNDGDIYVTRRCRSVVFWSVAANPDEHQRHTKLEREEEVKVFDLKEFRDQMRRFLCDEAASPQIPQIYFTVAQKWGPDASLHSCLVSIVVTPMRAAAEIRSINHNIKTPPVSINKDMLQFSGPDVPTPPNQHDQPWAADWAPHPQTYNTPPTQVFATCMT